MYIHVYVLVKAIKYGTYLLILAIGLGDMFEYSDESESSTEEESEAESQEVIGNSECLY
jgi:hypothetical protein